MQNIKQYINWILMFGHLEGRKRQQMSAGLPRTAHILVQLNKKWGTIAGIVWTMTVPGTVVEHPGINCPYVLCQSLVSENVDCNMS